MKELSVEQKAKAYDEAIAHAKKLLKTIGNATLGNLVLKNEFEIMFPELAENERIRKALSAYFAKFKPNDMWDADFSFGDIVAWFEKQGEQKPAEFDDTNAKRMFIKALERVEEQNNKGYKFTDCDKNSWWEDFKTYASCTVEQNPTNKAELKFHEGEWVVYNNDICQIVKREEGCNKLVTVFGIEKELVNERNLSTAHLWTIQDAKDGDVLLCECKHGQEIGIVKRYIGKYGCCDICFETYCSVDWDGIFRVGEYMGSRDIHPATKEQRDQLEKAMADAGYIWDSKSKRLLSLKAGLNYTQNPAWSEEDDNCLSTIIAEFSKCSGKSVSKDEWMRCNDFLNSLKGRVQPQKQWKPSDEQMGVIEAVINNRSFQRRHLDSLYEQLKRLREK